MKEIKKLCISIIMTIVMLGSPQGMASALEDFHNATVMFQNEKYLQAIDLFKVAERKGMSSEALYYNMASTYYKLQDYSLAKEYFKKLKSNEKMRPIAAYNIGLIEVKNNDNEQAIIWFKEVLKTTGDPDLYALAENKLKQLQPGKSWSGYIDVGLFYNDNVDEIQTGNIPTGRTDRYISINTGIDKIIQGDYGNGWIADFLIYKDDYSDVDAEDFAQYGVGVANRNKLDSWRIKMGLHFDKSVLASEDYQTIVKFELSGKKTISKNKKLDIRYRLQDISSDNILYDYLEGIRQRIRIRYKAYGIKNSQNYSYEYEWNDRADTLTTSYSPVRHTIRSLFIFPIENKWKLITDLSYRVSHYEYPQGFVDRNDDRIKTGLYGDYLFSRDSKLRFSMTYYDNKSSIPDLEYSRSIIGVAVSHNF